MFKAIRDNPRAVAYAVLMHLILLALLVIGLDWTPKADSPGSNTPIQAELVTQDPLKQIEERKQSEAEARRKAEQEVKQKAADALKKQAEAKQQAEIKKQQQAEIKKQQQDTEAKQQAQQKAAAEAKKKAETLAKQKAEAKQKAATEAKQKAAAEAQQKAAMESKQKAEAEAAARRKAEAELQAQLAAEQSQARAQSALSQYIPYIQDKVNRAWIRPQGSRDGLVCVVRVRLIPGGEVVGATVIQGSGDPIFDRSVETAVLKASPLPLPPDPALFNHFREINFKFNPGR